MKGTPSVLDNRFGTNFGMMETIEKEDEGKLESILNAAQLKFGQYGLAKTTMTDIATEVGMGKASLYYYFPNKEKLYEAVIIKEQEHFIREIQKSIKPSANAVSVLRVYTKRRMALFESCLNLSKINSDAMLITLPSIKKMVSEFGKRELEVMQTIIRLGISNGEFREVDEKEQAEFLIAIMAGLRIAAKFKKDYRLFENEDYSTLNKNMLMAVDMFIKSIQA